MVCLRSKLPALDFTKTTRVAGGRLSFLPALQGWMITGTSLLTMGHGGLTPILSSLTHWPTSPSRECLPDERNIFTFVQDLFVIFTS